MSDQFPREVISVKVAVDHDAQVNRSTLIDRLLAGINRENTTGTWDGDSYVMYTNSHVKWRLLNMFGANHTLQEIDAQIKKMVFNGEAAIERTSDDVIELRSGQVDANVDLIFKLLQSGLSPDILSLAYRILSNITTILASEDFIFSTKQVDVSLLKRLSTQDVVLFHSRFDTSIKNTGSTLLCCSTSRRQFLMYVSLRRICITKKFILQLEAEDQSESN